MATRGLVRRRPARAHRTWDSRVTRHATDGALATAAPRLMPGVTARILIAAIVPGQSRSHHGVCLPPVGAKAIFHPMTDRRYDDDEIAAILGAAVEHVPASPQSAPGEHGLTLADLQAIGQEVGISPAAIAHAAKTIEVPRAAVSRSFLGLPIGVERTVTLNRRLSDEEWERLVVELREVFGARGTTRSDGTLRQWTNGNLYALLEPVANGYRLRFGSVHGAARARITAGLAALAVIAALTLASAISGNLPGTVPEIAFALTAALGMVGGSALRLPRWARLRGSQMEALGARLALLAGTPVAPPPAVRLRPGGAD